MKKQTSTYTVTGTFRTSGYTINHETGVRTSVFRTRSSGGDMSTTRSIDDGVRQRWPAPVHGAPMPASRTLLAAMLRKSVTNAALQSQSVRDGMVGYSLDASHPADLTRHLKSKLMAQYATRPGQFGSMVRKDIDEYVKGSKHLVGRLIGLEIECYPKSLAAVRSQVDAVSGRVPLVLKSDGSLSSGGGELCRIAWSSNDGRLNGLLGMAKMLRGARVDKTCGLHVHVDCRHLPTDPNAAGPLLTAANTYDRLCTLAPWFKMVIPKSRAENKYCEFVNNRRGADDYKLPSNGERYAAFNWLAYAEHKTIEFRMAAGSTNVAKIESWALLCQHVLNHCANKDARLPASWDQFLAILPQWMADWCILRHLKLHGQLGSFSARALSAIDLDPELSLGHVD